MGPDRTYHKGDPFGSRDARGRLVLDGRAAAELSAIRAELRRLGKVTIAPPLEYASDAAGRRWGVSRPARVYAKLTGSSSPYSWAEATRSASGVSSLVTGGRSGTAYEANSATGLGGTYATLDWTPAGDWRFQAIRAGTGSGTTTPIATIPNCSCTAIPQTLTMTSSDHSADFSTFQDGTIQWGPMPSWAAGLNTTDPGFFGTATHPDPVAGDAEFIYYLACQVNLITLTRLYQTSPYGSPFRDGILYSWSVAPPNTCNSDGSGFSMTSGSPYAGSDPVTVTLAGP